MYLLRRSALQSISKNSVLCPNPRSFSTVSFSILSRRTSLIVPQLQKRWASQETSEGSVPPSNFSSPPESSTTDSQDSASISSMIESAASTASELASDVSSSVSRTASAAKSQLKPPSPGPQLYVGNLFFEVTEQDLKDKFGEYGAVTSTKVIRDPRGLSKGYGYINYTSEAEATSARNAMNQTIFAGRPMNVQYAHARDSKFVRPERKTLSPKAATRSLYLGNLSFDSSDEDIHNIFKDIKDVIEIRVAVDRRTGRPRGFAHADFTDIASAEQGKIQLADKIVHGRPVYVDFAMQRTRDHLNRVANEVES